VVWWRIGIRLGLLLCICVALAACSSQRTRPRTQKPIALSKEKRPSQKPQGKHDDSDDGRPFPREGNYGLLWPIEGQITSRFGPRRGSFHDGLDISSPLGTPILAAASGEVIYSGALRGYGNLVILRHREGYATVYAHTQKNLVKEGERVRRGQAIARVGQTGRASGPHLHFEIRKDNLARNPLRYLPEDRRTVRQDR
jgi:murein DD-endopeptidase MepM/ murein hydrolase activator NlpD